MSIHTLASLRCAPVAHAATGFQYAEDPTTNTFISVGIGAGVTAIGAYFFMRSCRSKTSDEILAAEVKANQGLAKASNENAPYFFGMKAGYNHAARIVRGEK